MPQERYELLRDMLRPGVKTLAEVMELRRRAQAWLRGHPDDREVLEAGESLVMIEQGLRMTPTN